MVRALVNGIHLNVEEQGDGRPLLLLHGFTGSADSWSSLAPVFVEAGFRVLAVDLVGHGRSDAPADPERYRMECCVDDLLAALDAHGVERTAVLGYSMGGRVALHLAAAAPRRVGRLVLESASPGIADDGERRSRVESDERLAASILSDGLVSFVDRWERLPLFAGQAALPAEARAGLRAQRLGNNPLGLANSLRGMGAGRQEPLWEALAGLQAPTLLVAGGLDAKYVTIGRAMADALPNTRLEVVPEAGHTVHLEQPRQFMACVLPFLNSVQSSKFKDLGSL